MSLPDSLISGLRDEIGQNKFDELINLYDNLLEKHKLASECEKELQTKQRDYEKQVLESKINTEKLMIQQQENGDKFKSLRENLNDTQLASAKEERTVSVLQYELQRVEETNNDLQTQVNDLVEANKQVVQTELQRLKSIIYSLKDDTSKATRKQEKETLSLNEMKGYYTDLIQEQSEKIEVRDDKMKSIDEMESPEDIKIQIEEIKMEVARLSSNADSIASELNSCESNISQNLEKLKKLQSSKKNLSEQLGKEEVITKKRCHKYEETKMALQRQKAREHKLAAERLELEINLKEIEDEKRHVTNATLLERKNLDMAKRNYIKKMHIVNSTKEVIANLRVRLNESENFVRATKEEKKSMIKQIDDLKMEVDSKVLLFAKQKSIEKESQEKIDQSLKAIDEYEIKVERCQVEEKKLSKIISVMNIQRDIKMKEATQICQSEKGVQDSIKLKELVILDMENSSKEIKMRLKEFQALYNVVKMEGSNQANLVTASEKAIVDMKKKMCLVETEIDSLRNEVAEKKEVLMKECEDHESSKAQKRLFEAQLSKLRSELRDKKGSVDLKISEIQKLNTVLGRVQSEIIVLKSRYKKIKELKCLLSKRLADKKSELCSLQQKVFFYGDILKQGEASLRKKQDDNASLKLKHNEVDRQIRVLKQQFSIGPKLKEKIQKLEAEIEEEKRLSKELGDKLEDPTNEDRLRQVGGSNLPDIEQLNAKVCVLEQTLNDHNQSLTEKEVLLEEVTMMTNNLISSAENDKQKVQGIYKKINSCQKKLRDLTRSMMAIVSELSMYQATAMKLEEDKNTELFSLDQSIKQVESGEPPCEEAARDLQRLWREKRTLDTTEFIDGDGYLSDTNLIRTTAEQRPCAYIPDDDIGIPKPFGMHPFKAAQSGSTMKQHIRPPSPKELII